MLSTIAVLKSIEDNTLPRLTHLSVLNRSCRLKSIMTDHPSFQDTFASAVSEEVPFFLGLTLLRLLIVSYAFSKSLKALSLPCSLFSQ